MSVMRRGLNLYHIKFNPLLVKVGFLLLFHLFAWIQPLSAQDSTIGLSTVAFVYIEGNRHITDESIILQLQTKPGELFSQYKISNDIRTIFETGYFQDIAVDKTELPEGIQITFLLKENPLIKEVVFEGNEYYRDRRLLSEIQFQENAVFQEKLLEIYQNRLKSFYRDKDFIVDIKSEIQPIDDESVRLKFIILEERRPRIIRIDFTGNNVISTKELRRTIRSKHSWLFFTHRYDALVYAEDLRRIERLYKNNGYVRVNVIAEEPVLIPERNGVILQFTIEEGPQYKIGSIDISGNRLFSQNEIQQAIHSKTGNIYNQSLMEGDTERLYNLYANQGYVLTNISHQLTLDDENMLVNISYNIVETDRVYIGDIRIQGISIRQDTLIRTGRPFEQVPLKTRDKVILRELTLVPGDVLYRDETIRSQQRLMNLGFFDGVDIRYEPTISMNTLDLVLYLAERQTGVLQLGVGYSIHKKATIFMDLQERNLFGTGRSVRLKTELASDGSEFIIGVTDPYFLDTRLSVTLELYQDILNREIQAHQIAYDEFGQITFGAPTSHEYEETQTGAGIMLSYPISQHFRSTLQMRYRRSQLKAQDAGYVIPAPLGPVDSRTISITPGITYDTRDNIFWPTEGVRYVANIEFAGGPLGADNDFVKIYAEGNWYKSFGERFIAAARLRGGYLETYGDTDEAPISDRFFLGGAHSVRGYDFRGISPTLTYIDTENNEIVELTVGGDIMLNMNMELRTKLTPRVMSVFFLDAGGVWREIDDVDLSEIRFGVGPGLILNLPIGHFQIGYGFPLNSQPEDEIRRFYFTFGSTF